MSRTALILSGRFGKGHDTVAEATAAALEPLGVDSRIVDSIALLGRRGAAAGDRTFRALLARPAIYDALHFSQLRAGGRLARWMDRTAIDTMYPQLLAEVERRRPDVVVSVFATGAGAAARYKLERPDVVTAVFITDSYAHRLWVHDGTDLFLTTSQLCARSIQAFRPHARVAVVAHPTRREFHHAPDQEVARAALGVPAGARCALLMSGAWGIGPIAETAAALARAGVWVLAVAGTNAPLHARLRAAAAADRRVLPFGYTDEVPLLMAASDVVITASGDTCREARVVGRKLILLDVVAGHGRENLQHELELGGAAVSSTDPATLVDAVDAVLCEPTPVPAVADPAAWEVQLRAALASVGVA